VAARFWIGCAVFHAVMLALSAGIGLRWQRHLRRGSPRTVWLRAAVADAGVWASCAVLLALLAALYGANAFTAVRLLSQALFGELLALTAWGTALFWRRGHRPTAAAAALACIALLATYAEAYHREPTDLHVRRYSVDASRGRPVHGRIRIVQLSDIQTDHVGSYEEQALRTAAAEKPDLVVLTGDYVQPRLEPTRASATAALNRLLRDVRWGAPLGVFAVKGDVDSDWLGLFAGTGVTPLAGEIATRPLPGGRSLSLIGLTTRMSHGRDPEGVAFLVRRSPADDLRIAVGHGPDFVHDFSGERVDLALAGHTHGGQVVLPWLGAPYTKSGLPRLYASGLHDYAGVPLHVSAGIGMERGTAPQLRFLCPPELSVIEVTY
jgi:uncharacterized protein